MSAFITASGATFAFTSGSATVTVTGANPVSEGVLAGDFALDPNGLPLPILSVAAGSLTLARNAPTTGTPAFIVMLGPSRSLVALATQTTREVWAQITAWADRGLSIPVIARQNDPASTPADGDRYLVGTAGTGAWSGKNNLFATWSDTAGAWLFTTPEAGWSAVIIGSYTLLIFTGSAWGEVTATGTEPADGSIGSVKLGGDITTAGKDMLTAASALDQRVLLSIGSAGLLAVDADGTLANNSDTLIASQKATKTYSDTKVAKAGDTMTGALTVSVNTSALPSPDAGTMLHLGAADTAFTRVTMDAFGAAPAFSGRRANGTNASKTALTSGTQIFTFGAQGWNGSAYSATAARVNFLANEDWASGTNQGTRVNIDATPNGSTTQTTIATFSSVGITPGADNVRQIGSGSLRWSEVFAATGTINTSDETEKHWIGPLSPAEMRVARRLTQLIGTYQWNAAVREKGAAARVHIGVTAQGVAAAFEAEGLDPAAYAVWCRDEMFETVIKRHIVSRPVMETITVTTPVVEVIDGVATLVERESQAERQKGTHIPVHLPDGTLVLDDDGNPVMHFIGEVEDAEEEYDGFEPTGESRQGIRYDQLYAFVTAAALAEVQALSERIAALEQA